MFASLATAYKQINAPVGQLGIDTLEASTAALAGDDATYATIEAELTALTTKRDALAATIIQKLEDAEFHGKHARPRVSCSASWFRRTSSSSQAAPSNTRTIVSVESPDVHCFTAGARTSVEASR